MDGTRGYKWFTSALIVPPLHRSSGCEHCRTRCTAPNWWHRYARDGEEKEKVMKLLIRVGHIYPDNPDEEAPARCMGGPDSPPAHPLCLRSSRRFIKFAPATTSLIRGVDRLRFVSGVDRAPGAIHAKLTQACWQGLARGDRVRARHLPQRVRLDEAPGRRPDDHRRRA